MSKIVVSEIMRTCLCENLHNYTNNIVGKVKTILDMICEDDVQLKASHDLATQGIWGEFHDLRCEINYFCDCLAEELNEEKIMPKDSGRRNSIFPQENKG